MIVRSITAVGFLFVVALAPERAADFVDDFLGAGFAAAGAFFAVATSGPGMRLVVGLEEPRAGDVGISLRGGNAGMPQQLLDRPDVGSSFQ